MEKYKDNYGEIWTRIQDWYVHSPKLGWGLWDNGRGLTRI